MDPRLLELAKEIHSELGGADMLPLAEAIDEEQELSPEEEMVETSICDAAQDQGDEYSDYDQTEFDDVIGQMEHGEISPEDLESLTNSMGGNDDLNDYDLMDQITSMIPDMSDQQIDLVSEIFDGFDSGEIDADEMEELGSVIDEMLDN